MRSLATVFAAGGLFLLALVAVETVLRLTFADPRPPDPNGWEPPFDDEDDDVSA